MKAHKVDIYIVDILGTSFIKILPVVYIFTLAIMTYLKRLFENCYLKIVSSFSSLTLHALNLLLWKKIISVRRPTSFRIFVMGRLGCPTKQRNWGGGEGGGFPWKSKSLNFPLLLDKNITYWKIPHIGKKGISISF